RHTRSKRDWSSDVCSSDLLEDVDGAKAAPRPSAAADGEHREPLSRMRKAIAERMSRSWREAPQFSVSRDVDMTSANAARKKAGRSEERRVGKECRRRTEAG